MVTPRKSAEGWNHTVKNMMGRMNPSYAEFLEEGTKVLPRYLAWYFGSQSPSFEALRQDAALREKYRAGQMKSLVNVNTAPVAALIGLPHIDKACAETIVEYRKTHSLFKSAKELREVIELEEEAFQDLEHLIAVN